jgi:hypothetical protein
MEPTQILPPIPEPVRLFLDSCLWDKGIKDVPAEMKEQMIQNLAARLNAWMMQAALMHLPDKDASDLEKLSQSTTDPEEIQGFFRSRIPNLDKIFNDAMTEFKQAYLNG